MKSRFKVDHDIDPSSFAAASAPASDAEEQPFSLPGSYALAHTLIASWMSQRHQHAEQPWREVATPHLWSFYPDGLGVAGYAIVRCLSSLMALIEVRSMWLSYRVKVHG